MMYKNVTLFILILLLTACSASIFSPVYTKYDDMKRENLSLYQYDGRAYSVWKKAWFYMTQVDFKSFKGAKRQMAQLDLSFDINPTKTVSDTLYIKLGNEVFRIKALDVSSIYKRELSRQTNTEISKMASHKDGSYKRPSKELIKTHESVENYELEKLTLKFILSEGFMDKLKPSDQMLVRFYIDDIPYTIEFKGKILSKIKKVYLGTPLKK